MYMDMGAAVAKDMDGKQWMKIDLDALARRPAARAAASSR